MGFSHMVTKGQVQNKEKYLYFHTEEKSKSFLKLYIDSWMYFDKLDFILSADFWLF